MNIGKIYRKTFGLFRFGPVCYQYLKYCGIVSDWCFITSHQILTVAISLRLNTPKIGENKLICGVQRVVIIVELDESSKQQYFTVYMTTLNVLSSLRC